jgi:hypothetical protein
VTLPDPSERDTAPLNPQKSGAPCELDLTFRDPAGQLLLTPDHALRRVRPAAADETLKFFDSRLRADLEASGDLVASEVADAGMDPRIGLGELWLRHPRTYLARGRQRH